jgi:hypothetical protein
MSCDVQRRLRDEEIRAWTTYKNVEHSGSKDTDELRRRGDNANLASSRLHQHISGCPECRSERVGASEREEASRQRLTRP